MKVSEILSEKGADGVTQYVVISFSGDDTPELMLTLRITVDECKEIERFCRMHFPDGWDRKRFSLD